MMNHEICDGCGRQFGEGRVKYALRIEIFADFEEFEISEDDLLKDHQADIESCLEQIKETDPDALRDEVHKTFEFVLCRKCQRKYIENPLHPLSGEPENSQIH
ncbi:hypothetical protein ACFLU6_00960 [Acidobacteriota bacterium]